MCVAKGEKTPFSDAEEHHRTGEAVVSFRKRTHRSPSHISYCTSPIFGVPQAGVNLTWRSRLRLTNRARLQRPHRPTSDSKGRENTQTSIEGVQTGYLVAAGVQQDLLTICDTSDITRHFPPRGSSSSSRAKQPSFNRISCVQPSSAIGEIQSKWSQLETLKRVSWKNIEACQTWHLQPAHGANDNLISPNDINLPATVVISDGEALLASRPRRLFLFSCWS